MPMQIDCSSKMSNAVLNGLSKGFTANFSDLVLEGLRVFNWQSNYKYTKTHM